MNDVDPAIARRHLGKELRRLRYAAGLTQRGVAGHLDSSPSKIVRIESGAGPVSRNDLLVLLNLYRIVDGGQNDALLELHRASLRPSWGAFRDILSPTTAEFLGLESDAALIRVFEPQVVPGLLRTEGYARSLLTEAFGVARDQADRHVEVGLQRQQLLERDTPPRLWVVLDESALWRAVGGRATMHDQLGWLLTLSRLPHVTLQVLPLSAGATPGVRGAFTYLRFADLPDDVVYLERDDGAVIKDRAAATEPYGERFSQLTILALPPESSADRIQARLAELSEAPPDPPPRPAEVLGQHFVL